MEPDCPVRLDYERPEKPRHRFDLLALALGALSAGLAIACVGIVALLATHAAFRGSLFGIALFVMLAAAVVGLSFGVTAYRLVRLGLSRNPPLGLL